MDGAMPGTPQLVFGAVDVRDVAHLHIRAMTHPAAKGERLKHRTRSVLMNERVPWTNKVQEA
jgi:nucleoside-diphosphate-sugar epimerase